MLLAGQARQIQAVKHSRRVGAYGGPSIRVARGLYLHTGAFTSQNVSSVTPEVTDQGTIYFTDQRVLFVGAYGTKEYRYEKVANHEIFGDGVRLDIPNRQPVYYLTDGMSVLGPAYERVSQGLFLGRKTLAAKEAAVASETVTPADRSQNGHPQERLPSKPVDELG